MNKSIKGGSRSVSGVKIVAEAGVNHNGSLDMALRLVDAAADAGADCIKFQTFKADSVIARHAPKAAYQKRSTGNGTQLDMVKSLELSLNDHMIIKQHCISKNIDFFSTPFDVNSLNMLVLNLGMKTIKISSGDITNGPLLMETARMGSNVILSTGMSTLGDVEEALGVLAFGFLGGDRSPSRVAFREAYTSLRGRSILKKKMMLLHCTTEYPAPVEDIHLNAMDTLRRAFSLPVGYSDHTEGITVPIAAVALGACLIEKHFTLDRNLPGPDHQASLEPQELLEMVRSIRRTEAAIGEFFKIPSPSEMNNFFIARRSLVAAEDIEIGEPFTENNLAIKRPAGGMSPMEYWDLIGKKSKFKFKKDGMIFW
jgi:N-acetylneuraminate synthase